MVSLIALKVFTSKPYTCQLHKSTALLKKLLINIFLCRLKNHAWNNDKNVELCKFYAAFFQNGPIALVYIKFLTKLFLAGHPFLKSSQAGARKKQILMRGDNLEFAKLSVHLKFFNEQS